jgi:Fungal potassium channel
LIEGPRNDGDPLVLIFFKNLRALAIEERTQVLILSSMAFTLVIWVISMLLLLLALLFYVFFIWHYVKDETLTGYCRRKVETRLAKIVKAKTDKIWAKQEAQNRLDLEKKGKDGLDDVPAPFGGMKRQPTLPVFDESPPKAGFLSRSESVATLPRYQSQPGTPNDEFPPPLPESGFSNGSASLLNHASPMGQSLSRPQTSQSNRSYPSPQSSRGPSLLPNGMSADSRHGSNVSVSSNRYSPPWRPGGNGMEPEDDSSSYEMTESAPLPAALRPSMGPRRDVSSPAAPMRGPTPFIHPPARSFTSPGPGGMPPPGRVGTPGTPLRNQTQTPGPPRGGTPGPGMSGPPRSHTPGDLTRGRTPAPPGGGEFARSGTPTDFGRGPPPFARGDDSPGGYSRNQSPAGFARSQTPGVRGPPPPGDFARSQSPASFAPRGRNGSGDFARSHTPGAGSMGGRGPPEQHARSGSAADEPNLPWGTGPPGMAF